MFCYKCGKKIEEKMLFCPYCGEKTINQSKEELSSKTPKSVGSGFVKEKEKTIDNQQRISQKSIEAITSNDTTKGLKIAGGVIEIVAGAFWLAVSLLINKIGNRLFGVNLEIIQIIMPICFIFFGIMACTKRAKKKDFTTYGILNMLFIGLQFYYGTYVGLGILQMVLLFISGMLFFFVKPTQEEVEYNKAFKEYKNNEPRKNKFNRIMFFAISLGVAVIITLFCVFSGVKIKWGDGYMYFDAFGASVFGFFLYICNLIYFIIINANQKEYKLTLNLIWTTIAMIMILFVNALFVSIDYTDGSLNGIVISLISYVLYLLIAMLTYQAQYRFEFKNKTE